jgi:hypothetical protein
MNQNLLTFAYKHAYQNLDRGIIELLGPNGISTALYMKSLRITQIKMGFLFHYLFSVLFGVFIILTFLGL